MVVVKVVGKEFIGAQKAWWAAERPAAILEIGVRFHMVHHPLGCRFIEPLVVGAARLPIHAELQHVQELMRNIALPFLLLRRERNAACDTEVAEYLILVEQDVRRYVLAAARVGVSDALGSVAEDRSDVDVDFSI